MPTCFIIQPFDRGAFDKRYKEVIEPAVLGAGLEPYRVDQDPAVVVPIQDIERGIREATLCLADISLDNPNVWFELGFAIACKKEVMLICLDTRAKFPFDIQHRHVIRYSNESVGDFTALHQEIVLRAKARLEANASLQSLSTTSELAPIEGLNQQEMAVLVALAGNLQTPEDHVAPHILRQDMERSGFTKVASVFGLKGLTAKGFVEYKTFRDHDSEDYEAYILTERGWGWIMKNQSQFKMVRSVPERLSDDPPF